MMKRSASCLVAVGFVVAISNRSFAQTCNSDSFSYTPDGNLEAVSGGRWALTGTAGQITVLSQAAQLVFNNTTSAPPVDNPDSTEIWGGIGCVQCGNDQKLTITFNIKANSASPAGSGNEWQVHLFDPTGKEMGQWRGSPHNATPRINSQVGTTHSATLTDNVFDELKVVINFNPTSANASTDFYHTADIANHPTHDNEEHLGTIAWSLVGASNRPPNGTTTLGSISIVNLNRENVGTGDMILDDMVIVRCSGSCFSEITPLASAYIMDNFFTQAVASTPALPPSLTYTLENQSAFSINYTASEANADGSAASFPWFDLAPLSGAVTAGGTAPIVASISTPASPGIYSGSVKVVDDCHTLLRPVVLVVGESPWFVEPFQYPDGDLSPNGSWTGGEGGVVVVSGTTARVNVDSAGGGGSVLATISNIGASPCEDGKITAIVKVKGATSNGNNSWALFFDDSGGGNLATWYGTSSSVSPRTVGVSGGTPATLSTTSFDVLKVVIDTNHHTTEFLQNGTSLGTLSHGKDKAGQGTLSGTLGSISIQRIGRGVGDGATGIPTLDDIEVVGCPGTCFASIKPKVNNTQEPYALTGGATAMNVPVDFKLTNEGLESLSYSAQTVDINGSPMAYSWLSLTNPTGGPIAVGTVDAITATANVDTTGLPDGAQFGFVKLTDTCNPTRSYLRGFELNINDLLTAGFNFGNGDGDLALKPGWTTSTPTGVASPIQVVGGLVKITGTVLPVSIDAQHLTFIKDPSCSDTDPNTAGRQSDALVSIKLKVRGHIGTQDLWELDATPVSTTGAIFAGWFGSAGSARPFTKDSGTTYSYGSNQALTGGGVWDQLEAKINFNTNTVDGIPGNNTRFYFNGTAVATLSGVTNDAYVRNVILKQTKPPSNQDYSGDADPVIELDDLVVSHCVLGCHDPVFDVRDSSNAPTPNDLIDEHDLQVFEFCTGTSTGVSHGHSPTLIPNPNLGILECNCMDVNHDQKIDISDFAVFQRCYTGATGTINPNCDD